MQNLVLLVVGVAALWVSAKVKVPFYPVDMTMQTMVVLLIGAAYGWRLAGATLALYLAQGAIGMPVFTGTPEKGLGIAYLAGPTGGYLFGFLGSRPSSPAGRSSGSARATCSPSAASCLPRSR